MDVYRQLREHGQHFKTAFEAGLANLERRPPPVSERAALWLERVICVICDNLVNLRFRNYAYS